MICPDLPQYEVCMDIEGLGVLEQSDLPSKLTFTESKLKLESNLDEGFFDTVCNIHAFIFIMHGTICVYKVFPDAHKMLLESSLWIALTLILLYAKKLHRQVEALKSNLKLPLIWTTKLQAANWQSVALNGLFCISLLTLVVLAIILPFVQEETPVKNFVSSSTLVCVALVIWCLKMIIREETPKKKRILRKALVCIQAFIVSISVFDMAVDQQWPLSWASTVLVLSFGVTGVAIYLVYFFSVPPDDFHGF